MCRTRRIVLLLLIAAPLLAAGCSDVVEPQRGDVESLSLSPTSPTVLAGDQLQFEASVHGPNGSALAGRQIFWATEDTTVARVSSSGLLTALKPGSTRLAASSEGTHAVTTVEVVPRPVGTVRVSPDTARLAVRGTVELTATLLDDRGEPASGRQITWASSASDVATVDQNGRVTAVRPGTAEITATSEGKSGSARIHVVPGSPARLQIVSGDGQSAPAGQRLDDPLVVRLTDADGNPIPNHQISWSVASGGGSIEEASSQTDAEGRASARWRLGSRPGDQRAEARVGDLVASFTARGRPGSIFDLSVTPESAFLEALADTVRFRATAVDEFGNAVEGFSLTWTTLESSVATVDGSGLVTARQNGDARIVASAADKADTVAVRVEQAVATVQTQPRSPSLQVGQEVQLSVTVADRRGNPVAGAQVTWSSSQPSVASVDGTGRVRANRPGSTTVTASSRGVRDSSSVRVDPGPASHLAIVSGDDQRARPGETLGQPLVVRVTDAGGNPIGAAQVTWRVTQGGGRLSAGTASTNSDGRAEVRWTLGSSPGRQYVEAQVASLTVTFGALATPGGGNSGDEGDGEDGGDGGDGEGGGEGESDSNGSFALGSEPVGYGAAADASRHPPFLMLQRTGAE